VTCDLQTVQITFLPYLLTYFASRQELRSSRISVYCISAVACNRSFSPCLDDTAAVLFLFASFQVFYPHIIIPRRDLDRGCVPFSYGGRCDAVRV